jgi:hypothetical protein
MTFKTLCVCSQLTLLKKKKSTRRKKKTLFFFSPVQVFLLPRSVLLEFCPRCVHLPALFSASFCSCHAFSSGILTLRSFLAIVPRCFWVLSAVYLPLSVAGCYWVDAAFTSFAVHKLPAFSYI